MKSLDEQFLYIMQRWYIWLSMGVFIFVTSLIYKLSNVSDNRYLYAPHIITVWILFGIFFMTYLVKIVKTAGLGSLLAIVVTIVISILISYYYFFNQNQNLITATLSLIFLLFIGLIAMYVRASSQDYTQYLPATIVIGVIILIGWLMYETNSRYPNLNSYPYLYTLVMILSLIGFALYIKNQIDEIKLIFYYVVMTLIVFSFLKYK